MIPTTKSISPKLTYQNITLKNRNATELTKGFSQINILWIVTTYASNGPKILVNESLALSLFGFGFDWSSSQQSLNIILFQNLLNAAISLVCFGTIVQAGDVKQKAERWSYDRTRDDKTMTRWRQQQLWWRQR